jgi:SAM-dependent methyltransferase
MLYPHRDRTLAVRFGRCEEGLARRQPWFCQDMFWNVVNRHDLRTLGEKVMSGSLPNLVRRFARARSTRVREAWNDAPADDQWWVVDTVRRRWRAKVCGDPDVDFVSFFCGRHLSGRTELDALLVGCGSGHSFERWVDTRVFRRLCAFDIAPGQVARAQERVAALGIGALVQVEVADAATLSLPARAYDVVIAEQTMHHMSPLSGILARLAQALRPGGFVFIDDFVGPIRHQWTPRQLAAANAMLTLLPEPYRRMRSGRVKDLVVRPSVARMLLTDPSEAVESSRILPLLRRHFELLEIRRYGGTLLEVVLSGIAHNFVASDPETRRLLDACFSFEDTLLAAGEIADDFVVVVGRVPH